jgi:hypothetical protein
MKFCYYCGHLTPGEPLFCNSCGRTYDRKLCSARHPNPRSAEVCSQCGSRDFSTPQPRVPLWTRCFAFLLRIVIAVLLVYLAVAFLIAIAKGLLASPQACNALLCLGILAALLYWIWDQLPRWMRKLIHRMVGRKGERRER